MKDERGLHREKEGLLLLPVLSFCSFRGVTLRIDGHYWALSPRPHTRQTWAEVGCFSLTWHDDLIWEFWGFWVVFSPQLDPLLCWVLPDGERRRRLQNSGWIRCCVQGVLWHGLLLLLLLYLHYTGQQQHGLPGSRTQRVRRICLIFYQKSSCIHNIEQESRVKATRDLLNLLFLDLLH